MDLSVQQGLRDRLEPPAQRVQLEIQALQALLVPQVLPVQRVPREPVPQDPRVRRVLQVDPLVRRDLQVLRVDLLARQVRRETQAQRVQRGRLVEQETREP